MSYPDKDHVLDDVKGRITNAFVPLHPSDRVDALREVADWATTNADAQDAVNEAKGTPERPSPAELDDDGDYLVNPL